MNVSKARGYCPRFLLWQTLRCDLWWLIVDPQVQNPLRQVTKAEQTLSAARVAGMFQTLLAPGPLWL